MSVEYLSLTKVKLIVATVPNMVSSTWSQCLYGILYPITVYIWYLNSDCSFFTVSQTWPQCLYGIGTLITMTIMEHVYLFKTCVYMVSGIWSQSLYGIQPDCNVCTVSITWSKCLLGIWILIAMYSYIWYLWSDWNLCL